MKNNEKKTAFLVLSCRNWNPCSWYECLRDLELHSGSFIVAAYFSQIISN
jgi:hypothetical protein